MKIQMVIGDESLINFIKNSLIFRWLLMQIVKWNYAIAEKDVRPEIMLLDDAYQHRKVKAGLYILTAFNDLYTNDFVYR
jgi:tetraacyldisaccharide-1-P 4'-kinase